MFQIHDLLQNRWSPRAFSRQDVEPAKLRRLFEAARWAPSCFNDQPWFFIIGCRGRGDASDRLFDCLIEFNQSWAVTAPVLLINVARTGFAYNGNPNRHAWYDTGQAMGNLLVEATHLGLVVHQMAGFDPELARAQFKIPDGYDAVAAAALGYVGDPSALPEGVDEKKRDERERKPLEEFVFSDSWNVPFPEL
jgi:nitroreductase